MIGICETDKEFKYSNILRETKSRAGKTEDDYQIGRASCRERV